MSPHHPSGPARRLASVLVGLVALVGAGALPAAATAPAASVAAVADDEITFTGHGWGHGRGMGQYGALGYAVDHGKGYSWILDHFYGGTVMGQVGVRTIAVELTAITGVPLVVAGTNLMVNGAPVGSAALVVRLESGSVRITKADTCHGPERADVGVFAQGVSITSASSSSYELLPRVCEASGERAYRGALTVQAHASSGVQTTFNVLSVEDYLKGVVPRESPASWGALGGGAGMEALKAQAVAARSYALASSRASGATTCDTTACQVYGGAAFYGSSATQLEQGATTAAVSATAGQVRVSPGAPGIPMRTEFSSSTGGWTAGGVFPAVEDLGDAIATNPNHVWTTTFTASQIAARLGLPGVRSVVVSGRNGYGDFGGRVTSVAVVDTSSRTHTYTGAAFRTAMGTATFKSDWFAVASVQRAQAEAVVKALYADLLGRGADASGLEWWSSRLMTGTSQGALVAFLTGSDEYIGKRITAAYREVLGRAPEAAGLAWWHDAIVRGRATVDDVKRRFYDTDEYFRRSGGTNEGYLSLLYRTMLGRSGSAQEIAAWSAQMARVGRGPVVDAIWFSTEAAVHRAGGYYRVFLKRSPDQAGQTYWGQVLLRSGEGAVRVGIAGSPEYAALSLARFP